MDAQFKDCRIVGEDMPTPAAPDEGMPPAACVSLPENCGTPLNVSSAWEPRR
jgi:hypothetical protein